MAGIHADLQIMRAANWRADGELAAKPRRRRTILIERGRRGGAGGGDSGELRTEFAGLDISQRFDAPIAAMNKPHAGVGTAALRTDQFKSAHPFVVECPPGHLKFGSIADRQHCADTGTPTAVARRNVDRAALRLGYQHIAVTAIIAPADRHETAAQLRRQPTRSLP